MGLPDIASREDWLAARTALLETEKALTRARDALAAERRRLPMVRIEKDYRFEGRDGTVSLLDLFAGRSQLVVGHLMFDPEWEDGCPSCSAGIDEVAPGKFEHLAARDTTLVFVSRAPLAKLDRWQRVKGWDIPWYSSYGSDFNYDFHVTLDPAVAPVVVNYGPPPEDWEYPVELPGTSTFLRVGDDVFHTYSLFARGAEDTSSTYQVLDLTALGRQEDWEEPKGRADAIRSAHPGFED
ncbi:MAG: hypothetical protein QOI80_2226 [Solirubrobacteraceae bacterium]|jgi:predicted dithiol-disulfide oxidoreductase (DUF899 family)|nr:hypothetical protein [Solirubrobacteraceae bacterium]